MTSWFLISTNRMLAIILLISFVVGSSNGFQCHFNNPSQSNFKAPGSQKDCIFPGATKDTCFVSFEDYLDDKFDTWSYGCLMGGSADCNTKIVQTSNKTNHLCCCNTTNCNTLEFARSCFSKQGLNVTVINGASNGAIQNSVPIFVSVFTIFLAIMVNYLWIWWEKRLTEESMWLW